MWTWQTQNLRVLLQALTVALLARELQRGQSHVLGLTSQTWELQARWLLAQVLHSRRQT